MLLRLFLLGVPVERARFDELVGAQLQASLAEAGLLVHDADVVHGAADSSLTTNYLSRPTTLVRQSTRRPCPRLHRPSVALAHLTIRGQGERALDLCTGNGIQAILLAAHAERVVATDVNERALAYAAFNAALNGADNVETRPGSFFEPVEGEQFDLVVANPPYVVSPENAYLFRDSGMPGDAVSEHVVRATPAALAPGGFACLLIAWALDPDDPAERPRSWLEDSGCDAYLLHTSTDDPIETATVWNRDLLDRPEDYAQALDRWLAYYRELGIEQLGYACLVLRKRSDGRDGWLEAQQLPRAALRPAGRHVRKLFETRDRMSAVDSDSVLLERRLRVVDDAVVTQDTRFAEGRWQAESLTLRLENGPLPAGRSTTARLIRELDGSKTLDEALREVVDDDAAHETGLGLARRMLEIGFLDSPSDRPARYPPVSRARRAPGSRRRSSSVALRRGPRFDRPARWSQREDPPRAAAPPPRSPV